MVLTNALEGPSRPGDVAGEDREPGDDYQQPGPGQHEHCDTDEDDDATGGEAGDPHGQRESSGAVGTARVGCCGVRHGVQGTGRVHVAAPAPGHNIRNQIQL